MTRAITGKKTKECERANDNEETSGIERAAQHEQPASCERELHPTRRSSLGVVGDACLTAEQVRIRMQIRLSHLQRRHETCPDTMQILQWSKDFEAQVDGMLAQRIVQHPVWEPFLARVKGCGRENSAKLVAEIERFGRYYPPGDPMIPSYVDREPEEYPHVDPHTQDLEYRTGVWVEGIERLTMPSKLRKLAGHMPSMKREKGTKLAYNIKLKMLTWRLGGSLLRAGGRFADFYHEYRPQMEERLREQGIKVLPTPKERLCPACEREWSLKKAVYCPDCGGLLSLKTEPPGVIWIGHAHNRAAARMRQMFLDALWACWREQVGLPVVTPYVQGQMNHQDIRHWRSWLD